MKKDRPFIEFCIGFLLALAGFTLAFGLPGCASPAGQPVQIPAPPLVRY